MRTPVRPYRGVSADTRKALRRAALLEAALDIAGNVSPQPVTMTAVCERAGLTERYFYESFKDRESLLLELLDGIAAELLVVVEAGFESAGTVEHRVRAAIGAFVSLLDEDPRKGRFALIEAVAHPALRVRRQEIFAAFEQVASDRSHQLHGELALPAPVDQLAAVMFVGGLGELVSRWLTGDLEATTDNIIDVATQHFLATTHL